MTRFTIRRVAAGLSMALLLVMTVIAGSALMSGNEDGGPLAAQAPPVPAEAVTAEPAIPVADGLDGQLQQFVEAYFFIAPTDTANSRLQRVSTLGLVSAESLQQLAFAPTAIEAEYQRLGIIQHAGIDPRSVSATTPDDPAAAWQVSAPVNVFWTDDAGNPIGDDEVWVSSTWVRSSDTWIMTSFTPEGGG